MAAGQRKDMKVVRTEAGTGYDLEEEESGRVEMKCQDVCFHVCVSVIES